MKALVCAIVLLCHLSGNSQSAWTQKTGEVYSQLSFSSISNYSEIFGNPNYQTERKITDQTLQLYVEYGYSNNSTLIINIPLKFIKTGDLTNASNSTPLTIADSKTNFGNIEIGLKHKFYDKKWIISAQLVLEANTSSYGASSGIRSGYKAWGATPTVNISRSFNTFYIQGFSGVQLKTNNYSSNFKIGGEFGYKVIKPVLLILYVDVVQSLKNGNIDLPLSNQLNALYVNDQSYGGYGLKVIGKINEKYGVTASFGGAFFGTNVAKKVALNIGLYHKF